ncbi:phage tail assembly chaperone G [Oceanobacillus jordanicus]|uniref:Uncharacterized protein n=1 Tax=Oceanobacillus jordanicus TaxID=2867266 RepID=A0AAW5B5K8_9BACI|nr:hypothetical protein [Oceanobacillus jordanicus]MCG3418965.1 hypothetical protein [Oceanobacillus jordanicus]
MANLKRNMLELIKNPERVAKGDEPEIEKVWTPSFIPLRVARDAIELWHEIDTGSDMSEGDKFDKLADFVANDIYGGKITSDDIYNRLHAPGGKNVLNQQIIFVAQGQQSDETKNSLARKD